LSHTQRMEMENKTNNAEPTKENGKGLTLSPADAEEYYAYKKQKKIAEILDAFSRSEGVIGAKEDAQRVTERALRIHQAAVRVTPVRFLQSREFLSRGKIKVDCLIGGDGETLPKVKAYETKLARKFGAEEITVVVTPSLVEIGQYVEIRKELKKIKRAVKNACMKVWVDKRYPYATLAHMGRICGELGIQYISVPYFAGCERLRFDLFGGCKLEVVGVDTLADFKKMTGAGVGRIVTSRGFEIYSEWMKEAEKIKYTPQATLEKKPPEKSEKPPEKQVEKATENKENAVESKEQPKKNPQTDYRCRLEGTELKFL